MSNIARDSYSQHGDMFTDCAIQLFMLGLCHMFSSEKLDNVFFLFLLQI